ncbi:MAG: Asp-tRNA(Asn)/Glu-tRNA(Gln) amidotransferase subunit GatB [Bdellovibrionales bacterium]|nr:Asp-tRNA(Asn)/Glu-tRNA(Gln) amidotransferase subunit GatB [Bdellovibrionales bacterium]
METVSNKRDVVIGLEIHAQVQTQSKMFSPDSADFASEGNENIHPVSLGFPGVLPCLNKKVVESALQVGVAFHCQIQEKSIFARKNYFYPDLPKGYQISQFDLPLLREGFVEFYSQGEKRKVHLERIHLEEDAGRLLHHKDYSLVDFNRAGVPLLEIVSYPEISSPNEAAEYAKMVRNILLYLKVCDGNLQEGSMRFDCNISLKPKGSSKLGTKVELKNLNSFRFMEKALNFEIKRQSHLLDNGESVQQETRLFNPKKNETFPMRSKEEASDYRYFPEPDLPPLMIKKPNALSIKELPFDKINRFCSKYKLPLNSASIIVGEMELCSYFEEALKQTAHAKTLCNWLINEVMARLHENKISIQKMLIQPHQMAEFVNRIEAKTLSSKMAKNVFTEMWNTGKSVDTLIKDLNLTKLDSEEDLLKIINQVFNEFPKQVEQYRGGKTGVYKFLMGQVMRLSKGQADPVKTDSLLKKMLEKQ